MRRHQLILAALLLACTAVPAFAQTGRAMGTVIDPGGRPIKGAIVKASNEDAALSEITAATDDKGRWAMIGLKAGVWTFSIEAPGFATTMGMLPIRSGTAPPPLQFLLQRAPEQIPGTLARDIDDQLKSAQALRDGGRLDQAISAYQSIQAKNPKLTTVNLVLAGLYVQKASGEAAGAARQALYDRALAAYSELLKTDPGSSAAALAAAQIRDMQK
jgi:tetratricopeptide (TPR) repeat protein